MEQTKQAYIALISALLAESEDIGLLDLIYRILQKSRRRGASQKNITRHRRSSAIKGWAFLCSGGRYG